MDIAKERDGLAYIMKKCGASSWQKAAEVLKGTEGFVISIKVGDGRKQRRYFVPMENVLAAESELKHGLPPMPWVHEAIERINDS